MQSKQRQTGLTMIELMIVVTIAAILAGIAAPSFLDLINNTRLTSTMTQLTSDLNRARSEAIKRNQRMLVCVLNSASTAATDTAGTDYCGSGTNWQAGWVVCYDENQNGYCDATSATNPNPVVVHPAINARLTLTGSVAAIRFNPNGTQGVPGLAIAETLTLAGSWAGAVTNVATIAATGNISRTP